MPPSMTDLRLILAAVEPPLADAWERFCGDLDFVSVHRGSILDIPCDAVVSPANSYGFTDGGIDAEYLDHFGSQIQLRVRRQSTTVMRANWSSVRPTSSKPATRRSRS
jgi:hypothetical protein